MEKKRINFGQVLGIFLLIYMMVLTGLMAGCMFNLSFEPIAWKIISFMMFGVGVGITGCFIFVITTFIQMSTKQS